MSSAVVVGGGLGGLAAAGLLARAGMRVTLLEAASHLGGKSRRLTLAGQRIDTGPEFLTFLGIWEEYLRRWDGREDVGRAARIAGLDLMRLGVWVGPLLIEEDRWRLRKARSLIKLLALAPGHRLHREQVMETLWPELGMVKASNNLHQILQAARWTLASDPAEGSRYLASQDESLVLCPEGDLWVDVDA